MRHRAFFKIIDGDYAPSVSDPVFEISGISKEYVSESYVIEVIKRYKKERDTRYLSEEDFVRFCKERAIEIKFVELDFVVREPPLIPDDDDDDEPSTSFDDDIGIDDVVEVE